jgi:tRNA pseudouridine65 synthase
MNHIAHPILGDATHGKGALNRAVAGLLGLQRLWLHAESVSLAHPATGAPLRIQAPRGPEWALWTPSLASDN